MRAILPSASVARAKMADYPCFSVVGSRDNDEVLVQAGEPKLPLTENTASSLTQNGQILSSQVRSHNRFAELEVAIIGLSRRRAIRPNINFGVLTRRLVNEGATTWGDLYPAWQSYGDECERLL